MIKRRTFLSSLAAATLSSPSAKPQRRETEPEELTKLPPAITALKSRRAEAKPITVAERKDRIERARELMQRNKLDAVCMIGGTSLAYFTGIHWGNSERLFTFVVPQKGNAFYVSPAFEEGRAREQIAQAPDGDSCRVLTWQEDEDPYALVAKGLRDAGVSSGRIGMEERTTFVFSNGIANANPASQIVSATPVTAGCRMIKSPAEIALMRLAAEVSLAAYEAAWKSLEPGMTQNHFGTLVAAAHKQLGFAGEASIQVGEFSALPHGSRTPQIIREGTVLLMDGGCNAEGYASDISRTFVLGKATDKMKRVFEIVHEAQTTAVKTARPGLPAGQVDAAARKVITDAGYGPGYKYFTHRVGHGMGMDGHEWPYLVKGNTLPLEADMTFSDEPGIYIRGEFGVRLEDDMHIMENGAELFTPQSPSPEQPFARA
ncbi:MAG: aminopeptidase P family protein [Acidobacteriaceae bacterium]|nr:aminopeptidase P family protein [Acidobacteriaceae bacterium]